jgi:hypothetical protein
MMGQWLSGGLRRDGLLVALAFVVVSGYVLGAGTIGETGYPLDDAWIHQTYARNLAQTGQWAFVPGEPSAGSTSPLYTLLLSVGYVLGVPHLVWSTLLGGAALALAGLLAARLAEHLLPDVATIGGWAGLATVLAWHLIWAGASGMETQLFATLTLLLVWLAWRELDGRGPALPPAFGRGALLGLVCAAATLTRPEGAGLVGLLGLLMWAALPPKDWRRTLAWSLGVVAGWLVGMIPGALLNLSLGGSILPNTASAKQAENAILLTISYPGRVINLLFPLIAGGQLLLIPGMVVMAVAVIRRSLKDRSAILLLAPVLWAAALIGLYAARLPAPYQHGRYVIPALPHLILFGVTGTALIWRTGRGSLGGRVLSWVLALTAGLLFGLFVFIGGQQYARDVQIIQSEMVVTAHWLADNIPPDDLLAVHDIGAVGYFAPRPILDLAGLVSPEVIPIIRDADALWALMEQRGTRYLMALPDQIPGQDPADLRLCPIFSSGGTWSPAASGANMAVYALVWDGVCPPQDS